MVLLLFSIAGDEVPTVLAPANPSVATPLPRERCENARDTLVRDGEEPMPALRSLEKEPLANAYRPVVRYAHCDKPVVIAKSVGQQQR